VGIKMAGFDEGNNKRNSKCNLLTLACLSGALLYLGINVVGVSNENTSVAKASGSYVRRLNAAQHLAEEEIIEEMFFKPVKNVFEETVIHPQYHQLPPTNRRGPGVRTRFLIGIFSDVLSPSAKQRRQLIRETYLGNGNDPRICSLQDHLDKMDNSETSECKILYTFVVGGNVLGPDDHFRSTEPLILETISEMEAKAVNEHAVVENDVVHLNIRENAYKGKSPTWFKYAASLADKYGIDYIAKAESHVMLSMPHLIDYVITDLPPYPHNTRMFGGNFWYLNGWCAEGSFYFLSSDMAKYVSSDDLFRQGIRDSLNGKRDVPNDYEMNQFVWTHPYPVKFVFMSSRNLWIQDIMDDYDWREVWKTYGGVPPPSRSIESTKPLDIAPHVWKQRYQRALTGGDSTTSTSATTTQQ